jgi:hypothetical protein
VAIPVQDRATLDVLRRLVVGSGAAAMDDLDPDPATPRGPGDATDATSGSRPDWDAIEGFLVDHGLAGLAAARCSRAVRRGLPPPLPDPVLKALEPHRVRAALEAQVRVEALHRARRILRAAGVPSLAFKGGALVLDGTYRDPGERAFEDVDLLVHPGDAEAAVGALIGAGFRPWTPWSAERVGWVSAFTLDDPEAPRGLDATVDLHWSSLYGALRLSCPAEPDPLWEGADLELGLPGTEAHFVVLADHFLKHLRVVPHVRGLADLCRLGPRLIDGEALLSHARRRRSARGLTMLVRALTRLWGVAFPGDVIAAVGAGGSPTATERRYLAPRALLGRPSSSIGRLGGLVLRWRLAGGTRAAFHDIAQVVLPPAAWLRARYPGAGAVRARYAIALARWLAGLGPSPLSPNQDLGGDLGDGRSPGPRRAPGSGS